MNDAIDMGAKALTVIGGLNWGLVGIANTNLIEMLFGGFAPLDQLTYALIGLSALYVGYKEFFKGKN
ncbi:MAG: DUF378 domain-containing protein [Candidatus Altiarchaeota archaeon]|nr:DUF378 domain-containing protein [Candidatus Altiarchaeota archaeon]